MNEPLRICASINSHYGLPDVRTYILTVTHGSYSLTGTSFGYALYRENKIHGGYGFEIMPYFRVGLSLGLLNYWVKDLYSRYGYALNASACYQKPPIVISGWVHNINIPRFHDLDAIPPVYSVHVHYEVQQNVRFYGAIRGLYPHFPFFAVGLSGTPYKFVAIGIGANTDPLYLECMAELPLGYLKIQYVGTVHEYLGLSHNIKVVFDL